MTFSAVLFDLDGTLVDTEKQGFIAGKSALAQLGHTLTDALFRKLIGTDRIAGEEILRTHLGDLDFHELDRLWSAESRKEQAKGVPQKPGAETLLAHLKKINIPRAVATSSGRQSADLKLTKSGLLPLIDTVVSRDCVTHAKPNPEPFLTAAHRLDVAPESCLVFEDSDPGARAAQAAGMHVVQVIDMVTPSGDFAHHIAESLLEGAALAGIKL